MYDRLDVCKISSLLVMPPWSTKIRFLYFHPCDLEKYVILPEANLSVCAFIWNVPTMQIWWL